MYLIGESNMMDRQIYQMSSYKTGHARPHHYWESLPETMTGNSWDSFIQGNIYDTLPHALGCVRFAALKPQWVKAYKEVHKVRVANSLWALATWLMMDADASEREVLLED